jgi:tRNA (cytidine/uridine-2'-O-)-methyltransferase
MHGLRVVLFNPEIPPNTGNIARTCVATATQLHLIKPLGFSLENKYLKRAGLDYWEELKLVVHENWDEFLKYSQEHSGRFIFVTKKAGQIYSQFSYQKGDYLIFGSETMGVKEEILREYSENLLTIPMLSGSKIRSLNLSNAVSIVLYEALKNVTDNFKHFSVKEFGL